MSEFTPNPNLYSHLALAIPPDVANKRLQDFFEDLGEIRKKHSIPDVHCIVQQKLETESGEAPGLCSMHYGDERNALSMTSYAMGHAQGQNQKFVLAARSQGLKQGSELAMDHAKKYHDELFGDE